MVRNRNRTAPETVGSRVKNRIMKEVRGGNAPVGKPNPPKVNRRPWYPLVVEIPVDDASTPYQVSVTDLLDATAKQLGFQPETAKELCVRLHMVRVWAAPDGTGNKSSIRMSTTSLLPTMAATTGGAAQYGIINKVTDTGSVTDFAKVGYNWPLAQSDILLLYSADFVLNEFQSNASDDVVVHYHLHWTTTGTADPPTLQKNASQ